MDSKIRIDVPRDLLQKQVHRRLLQALTHELDEHFRDNGVLVNDPHKGERSAHG